MIAMWPKWWKNKPKMRKFKDTLYIYNRWKDLGEPFSWPSGWKKRMIWGAILLAIQIKEKVLLFLMRHIVFLEYKSNQGERGGSRNWLRGEVGIICPLWWFSSYFSRHSWQQYGRWYGTCPSGAIETHCCTWGELLQLHMVDVPKD
jgi:hypothetical protein